ncbi:hypothetical protein KUTeg_023501 [Tegillarca granosa]|uniref:EF-hand domain-containing protein n=1 Tax=Tegillarca granosa TaxID=220873 RepID=A0ABQ9E6R3_TEGGR|nr:hypothetical protein KUTeg_023501 [Tegillarca granosa]
MRNVIRSVHNDTLFKGKELEDLYILFKEEYLTSCYWRTSQQPADTAEKYDPSRPYYELYKVDFDQFKTMFLSLSPWAVGSQGNVLALRAFRFIDDNKDNMINFKEFVYLLGVICKADLTQKLKMLYMLHQPPALLPTDESDGESQISPTSPSVSTESAVEAEDFFDEENKSSATTPDDIVLPGDPEEPFTEPSTESAEQETDSQSQEPEKSTKTSGDFEPPHSLPIVTQPSLAHSVSTDSPVEGTSSVASSNGSFKESEVNERLKQMYLKKKQLNRTDSKAEYKDVPRLTQVQFIQLWKTLYDLFSDNSKEQELYHSIAAVGTLLLEIGEVGKRFYLSKTSVC